MDTYAHAGAKKKKSSGTLYVSGGFFFQIFFPSQLTECFSKYRNVTFHDWKNATKKKKTENNIQ